MLQTTRSVNYESTCSPLIFFRQPCWVLGRKDRWWSYKIYRKHLKWKSRFIRYPLPQHTFGSAMFGVIVVAAVLPLSSSTTIHHVSHYTPEDPKTFSLFLQKLVTQMKQDPQVCLSERMFFWTVWLDTLSYTLLCGRWNSVSGRSVCVLCTECWVEAAAPWPAGQDHSPEWAAGESCSLREHLLLYRCSHGAYACMCVRVCVEFNGVFVWQG